MKLILVTIASAILILGCSTPPAKHLTLSEIQASTLPTDWAAHWLSTDIIVSESKGLHAYLVASEQAQINKGVFQQAIALEKIAFPKMLQSQYPHLKTFQAYKVELSEQHIKALAKTQLALIFADENSQAVHISYVQQGALLDALYTGGSNDANEYASFGASAEGDNTTFALWSPTARQVQVQLFDNAQQHSPTHHIAMQQDPSTGIWSVQTDLAPSGTFYRYQLTLYHPRTQRIETLTVTDPYSLSLSTNSVLSQVIDLDEPETQPEDWQNQDVATLVKPEDLILYELHIRDFSAHDDSLINSQHRGKYGAFSDAQSAGMQHLKALHDAGLNTIHLLPAFDQSAIEEKSNQVIDLNAPIALTCQLLDLPLCTENPQGFPTLQAYLENLDPVSEQAQEIIERIRSRDGYNWGYDPYHYTVPEGSYAIEPNGVARIVEFRQMVLDLHRMGFRVVMDVVYNHTSASGLADKSVLDKVVPNYYHRLHPLTGAIEQSTCCENTATERAMMAKLMIDSLVIWAHDYKIDGFRFDLMAHQPKAVMLRAREAVREVDADTYFYGEGWDFGEVAHNARFVQASQTEMAGTQIGTYTDRLRDAVRGGSSFVSGDEIRLGQGIGNGLLHLPNELLDTSKISQMLDEYFLSLDQIRIGLAGNLENFPLIDAKGLKVTGQDVDYGDAPTGYAKDPADTINYVSKHDNQTLWDNNQYRIANTVNKTDRVRMQVLSLSYPILAQGIPFIHMGSELLRSKSFLRDSYDFSDWFNKVDFSKHTNNYNVGLPPAEKDQANWPLIKSLINNNQGKDMVGKTEIDMAAQMTLDLIAIRAGSELFRLPDAPSILQRLRFLNTGANQQLGLIVMQLNDNEGEDLDPNYQSIMVIFNHGESDQTFNYDQANEYKLHPRLQNSIDARLQQARAKKNHFFVPALSVAVFVKP